MHVLASCLRYGLPHRAVYPYMCTVRMDRHIYPRLPDHRLNTMCETLDIPHNHHEAGSDSRACAFLLKDYLDRGIDLSRFERQYDMTQMRTVYHGVRSGD